MFSCRLPVVEEEVVEEVPRSFQFPRRRQVVVQQRRRPVIVQRRVASRPIVTYVPMRGNRRITKRRFVTVSFRRCLDHYCFVFLRPKIAFIFLRGIVNQSSKELGKGNKCSSIRMQHRCGLHLVLENQLKG